MLAEKILISHATLRGYGEIVYGGGIVVAQEVRYSHDQGIPTEVVKGKIVYDRQSPQENVISNGSLRDLETSILIPYHYFHPTGGFIRETDREIENISQHYASPSQRNALPIVHGYWPEAASAMQRLGRPFIYQPHFRRKTRYELTHDFHSGDDRKKNEEGIIIENAARIIVPTFAEKRRFIN